MKKKLLVLATLAICAAIVATGTLAYFNAETQAHNVITTGRVGIELVEKIPDGDDADDELDDFKDVEGVMPGTTEYKMVSVKNIETQDAWIRVWLNVAISEPGDPISNPTIKCLPLTIDVNGTAVNVAELMVKENDTFVKLDDSQSWNNNWILGEDGYYYYRTPVEGGASTTNLFDAVAFAKEMGNEYQNCKVLIDVSAEAVQSANNPKDKMSRIESLADIAKINGWPNA